MEKLSDFKLSNKTNSTVSSTFLIRLKEVCAKNKRGYRLTAKKSLLITANLTSICCSYKEKIIKNDIY